MNILYVNFSFTVGGLEKLLVDILNSSVKSGEDKVYLCIINDKYDTDLLNSINEKVNIVLFNRKEGGSKLKYILKFTKFVLKEKINVIHCQTNNTVKFSVLSKIVNFKIKIFNTVHDSSLYTNLKQSEVFIEKMFCKKIIAISDVVKQEILSRGIDENKVVRIYNAIDLDKFKNFDGRSSLNKDDIVIGNVARLVPNKKGQDVLIKALSKLKNDYPSIKCILAGAPGEGQEYIIDELNMLCNEYGVQDNVVLMGNVNNIPEFLNKIDIFVLPSRYEGFGISLIEAMSTGLPCIASDIDGPKEIIQNNRYGLLFESENYIDLANKIKSLINNEAIIDKKIIPKYIEDNFEINSMVKKLQYEYKN